MSLSNEYTSKLENAVNEMCHNSELTCHETRLPTDGMAIPRMKNDKHCFIRGIAMPSVGIIGPLFTF